jgi:hypothetical protein
MNNIKNKDISLLIDFYLIGIDASIKNGNPDEDLLAQADRVASNDPAILLRKLMMKIYGSRRCWEHTLMDLVGFNRPWLVVSYCL